MSTQRPPIATRREFAHIAGYKPSYITELAASGRLVLTDDGKHVKVEESLARIRATRDPSAQGVADRHAAARAAAMSDDPELPPPPLPANDKTAAAGNTYQTARAVEKRYQALDAKRAYEQAMGQLRDAREVEHIVAAAMTELRTRLETLANTMAPTLAAINTEEAARAELATQFEHALSNAANHFANLAARHQTA